MDTINISTFHTDDLKDILNPSEKLLWSGTPCYGKGIFQVVGEEKLIHMCLFIGCLIIWLSIFLMPIEKHNDAIGVFVIITIIIFCLSFFIASSRQFILCNMIYFVTDKRALLVRKGRNPLSRKTNYVVSCFHSSTYPYKIIPDYPYPSLQIGNLFSYDQVQPLGLGIDHPGIPHLWRRVYPPVLFNYLDNAEDLLDMIRFWAAKADEND